MTLLKRILALPGSVVRVQRVLLSSARVVRSDGSLVLSHASRIGLAHHSRLFATAKTKTAKKTSTAAKKTAKKPTKKAVKKPTKKVVKKTLKKKVLKKKPKKKRAPAKMVAPPKLDFPKTPASTWVRFLIDYRKSHPDVSTTSIMKVAREDWKKVPESQKVKYNQDRLSELEKVRVEKEKFNKSLTTEQVARENLRRYIVAKKRVNQLVKKGQTPKSKLISYKRLKDPNRPIRPINAFSVFYRELYKQPNQAQIFGEAKHVTEKAVLAGQRWRNMSPAEKAPYVELEQKDRKRFEQEMKSYKPALTPSGTVRAKLV